MDPREFTPIGYILRSAQRASILRSQTLPALSWSLLQVRDFTPGDSVAPLAGGVGCSLIRAAADPELFTRPPGGGRQPLQLIAATGTSSRDAARVRPLLVLCEAKRRAAALFRYIDSLTQPQNGDQSPFTESDQMITAGPQGAAANRAARGIFLAYVRRRRSAISPPSTSRAPVAGSGT
jgi:hypothetical protein